MRLPLTMMDAAIVSQTMPGRPMTTHHVLELGSPLRRSSLERAVEHLAAAHPALRARATESFWRWTRTADPVDPARARACLEVVDVPGWVEAGGWMERTFALGADWPFRLRYGPTPRGTWSLCFTLHHSVTDGVGALTLFDELLAVAAAAEAERPLPALAEAPAKVVAPWRAVFRQSPRFLLGLSWFALRSLRLTWQHRAVLLDLPEAPITGFGVRVLHLSPAAWRTLKERATAQGCTRNDLLSAAVLRAAAAVRRERGESDEPWRMLTPMDLRPFFGETSPRSNWMGTIEVDVAPAELVAAGLEQLLHRRLAEGKAPMRAAATPVLLGALSVILPARLYKEMFRRIDAPGRANPFSLLVSHIRPPGALCWPRSLSPRGLWCASTLPRKPGLGVTVTTVGDVVSLAVCWPRPLMREATIDALVAHLEHELGDIQLIAA